MKIIRQLEPKDFAEFLALRRKSLLDEPLAFLASPEDDFFVSSEAVQKQLSSSRDAIIFGAFSPHLVGIVGLYRDRPIKCSHKAHIWGMYVLPSHRRQGIATALLQSTLEYANILSGISSIHLSVSSSAISARHLYEKAGFVLWCHEPDAIRHKGTSVDDYHLVLRLT